MNQAKRIHLFIKFQRSLLGITFKNKNWLSLYCPLTASHFLEVFVQSSLGASCDIFMQSFAVRLGDFMSTWCCIQFIWKTAGNYKADEGYTSCSSVTQVKPGDN